MDLPYNLRRDRQAGSLEYDIFASENVKDMSKMLEAVMEPEAHGHVFCSSL